MEQFIEKWKNNFQPYELKYWQTKGIQEYKNNDTFIAWWQPIFNWIGQIKEEVLDIGSGPRPCLKRGTVIDPLILEYIKIGEEEWYEGLEIISMPGEIGLDNLYNKFNFILCWNAIDHSYDPLKILENIYKYLKVDGKVALATDCFIKEHEDGHPILGLTKERFIQEVEKKFTIEKIEENIFQRHLCLILRKYQ